MGRSVIGPIAAPDIIQWAPNLPKTRSGKIMRRILRKVACKEEESIGDTQHLMIQAWLVNWLITEEKLKS